MVPAPAPTKMVTRDTVPTRSDNRRERFTDRIMPHSPSGRPEPYRVDVEATEPQDIPARPRRVAYDEFSMFHENASEFGLEWTGAPTVRREIVAVDDDRRLSALAWGEGGPDF